MNRGRAMWLRAPRCLARSLASDPPLGSPRTPVSRAAFTADHHAHMKRYKDERYDGITGAARWA